MEYKDGVFYPLPGDKYDPARTLQPIQYGSQAYPAQPDARSDRIDSDKNEDLKSVHSHETCTELEEGDGDLKREHWTGKLDFLLSCIGFAVGLGNVWRFPYLCYKNGGGAFLVPYLLCVATVGAPMMIMEVSLGQYMQKGGYEVWKICPIFQGIGVASFIIAGLGSLYYIVVMAWDVYYLVMSFTSVLPWSHCDNPWNTERCKAITIVNTSAEISPVCGVITNTTTVDPVTEFWERKILEISPGIDKPDGLVWQLAVSLLFVWILCYFVIWKGVRFSGKVVYFTATFPYVMLTILLVRGVTLDGAADGIIFYLKPDFNRLLEPQVWIDAGTQILYSYAISLGAMPALGSYNKFKHNCYRDTVIVCVMNASTSLYAGFIIFSILGFMAKQQGVCVEDVATSGPGLAFVVYPKAVTMMPFSTFWAILFFVMILFLGIDSQFVMVEGFLTVIMDQFPNLRRRGVRELTVAIYCAVSYLIGLSMVTRGGMYVFQLFDYYSCSGLTLLWTCFFETIVIAYIYGGKRFYDNMETMMGFRINPWLLICWTAIIPLIMAGIFVSAWIPFQTVKYGKYYKFPGWAIGLGMCLAFSSMVTIPGYFFWRLLATKGTLKERWRMLTTPDLPPHVTLLEKKNEIQYSISGVDTISHASTFVTGISSNSLASIRTIMSYESNV